MAQKADRFAPLQMDNAEICTMYKEAKNKLKQIVDHVVEFHEV